MKFQEKFDKILLKFAKHRVIFLGNLLQISSEIKKKIINKLKEKILRNIREYFG